MIHFAGEKSSLVQSDLFSTWQSFIWGFLLNCQGSKVKFWYSKTWLFSAKDEYNSIFVISLFLFWLSWWRWPKTLLFFTNTRLNLSHYQPWLQLLICLSFYYMNTSSSWCWSEKDHLIVRTRSCKKRCRQNISEEPIWFRAFLLQDTLQPKSKKSKMKTMMF